MLRWLERIIITIFIVFVIIGVIPYFALQTNWGAKKVSQWLSDRTAYHIEIGSLDHSIFDPHALKLNRLRIKNKETQQSVVTADQVTLITHQDSPFTFTNLKQIIIDKGEVFTRGHALDLPMPIKADQLQFIHSAMKFEHQSLAITAENINGGVMPWSSERAFPFSNGAKFRFTMANVNLDKLNTGNVFVQGYVENEALVLNNVGSDFIRGGLTTKIQRLPNGDWHIQKLTLNNLQLHTQNEVDAQSLSKLLAYLPKVTLASLNITNSSIDGQDLQVNQFTTSIENIAFEQGKWQLNGGKIAFSANDIVYQDEHFSQPDATFSFTSDAAVIERATAYWQEGLIQTHGQLTYADRTLQLKQLMLAKLRYTLPENGLAQLNPFLFRHVDRIIIDQFTLTPSTIVDISPSFPFELTHVELTGGQLMLKKNAPNIITQGKLSLSASSGTLNAVSLKHINASLSASDTMLSLPSFSAITNSGLVEAQMTLAQQAERLASLKLEGRSFNTDVLNAWRLLQTPLALTGNIHATLSGSLNNLPNLSGQLNIEQTQGATLHLNVVNGLIQGSMSTVNTPADIDNPADSEDDNNADAVIDELYYSHPE